MSDTETEPDHETQPVGIQGNVSPGIDFRLNGVEPSKLDDHLLPKEDDHSVSTQAHTVKSAVETLSQAILESDLENDDTLNLGLARAAQTISNFLKLAKLTVATEEDYDRLPGWMREDLIECLDMILSERFLNALFLLRQNISHLAIKREHVASFQMVTLSDVVIAAIVDYVSDTSRGRGKGKDGAEYQSIELAVRLPQRIDSFSNFLTSPIFEIEPDLTINIKLAALAILYCSRCLNPIRQSSEKNLADSISSFCLCAQLERLPDLAIAHLLCVYMSSCVDFKDELHPFKPATNAALWKLLIQLFPEKTMLSGEGLNAGQKMVLSHGALLMPWIWWNCSLCPAQDSNWVGVVVSIYVSSPYYLVSALSPIQTLLWIRQEYSWLGLNSNQYGVFLSDIMRSQFECLEETAKYLRVVNTLLENRAIGLKHLLGMKKDEKYIKESGIEEHFPKYTTLAVLQTYSAVSGLPTELLSKEENDEICTQVEKVIQVEIDGSFEGSTRLEVIDMTLSLPQSASDRLIQSLQIRFNLMLESLLLEIEVSADPTCCHEEKLLHQQRALSKLKFLTKCVEIQSLKEYLVKGAIFNLVNTLLTPLGCDHTVALATTKLILCISKSAKESWPLNQQQLQTVSNALIEVMADGHGTSVERKRWQRGEGVVASLVTADFVKGYCARFDYQVNYPLAIYGALREELADELWIHSGARSQTKSHLTNSGSNRSFHYGPSAPETHPGILVAEAMQILFKRFSDAQRKYVQQSPLTRELQTYLKSRPEEIFQILMLSFDGA
ncbi:hypothetical protein PTTG_12521 [Puccinia triticina 1-1 BBBD Race 1]|uniref:Uncharacterized protein n=1 Tax=Puccinia triticina (isolate 1-1 / race 1 (BBBD)) TaxID=630390 RepID=A0A180G9Q2_PUCT1|nr:hypothetical protein PTTG_12521 [Puccinia triticina 1-1 BBBD Race 1]